MILKYITKRTNHVDWIHNLIHHAVLKGWLPPSCYVVHVSW